MAEATKKLSCSANEALDRTSIEAAIELLRGAGYRVSRPRAKASKGTTASGDHYQGNATQVPGLPNSAQA
jgi:hypothetical protein